MLDGLRQAGNSSRMPSVINELPGGQPRLLLPKVIQTSEMDCGPACLKALLAGFEIPINYNRLREACQTDIDGTSLDVLEDVALMLGLDAAQYVIPADHLLMAESQALPGIVVTQLPNGLTHFVVAWRRHGPFLQVMDPGSGRAFRSRSRFLKDVFIHRFPANCALARMWLTAPEFLAPLRQRLANLGFPPAAVSEVLDETLAAEGWLPVAALDAAVRFVARLIQTKAMARGAETMTLVRRLAAAAAQNEPQEAAKLIPARYWSIVVRDQKLALRGAVILRALGRMAAGAAKEMPSPASPELAAAVGGDSPRPLHALMSAALAEQRPALVAVLLALLLAGGASAIETLLISGTLNFGLKAGSLSAANQIFGLVVAFLLITTVLNLSTSAVLLRLGRWVEIHLRARFLDKLPRLGSYYFHSRLTSDLAQRAHALGSLRALPSTAGDGIRIVGEFIVTAGCVMAIAPSSVLPILLTTLAMLGLPFAVLPLLREQELRTETHAAGLTRFYLNALQGLTALRAHRAEPAIRIEHERLLSQWMGAIRQNAWTLIGSLAAGLLASSGFAIWMVVRFIDRGAGGMYTLLALYWALKLPTLALSLIEVLRSAPGMHIRLCRIFELLTAPEEADLYAQPDEKTPEVTSKQTDSEARPAGSPALDSAANQKGVHICLRSVSVQAAGQRILSQVNLEIRPGEHVAIIGPSGSGKTSLLGLLLGWHRAIAGTFLIDGEPAQVEKIRRLRRETAWVDPAVQIWNRSLAQNILYGNGDVPHPALEAAIQKAQLTEVVQRLPSGLASALGEGGGLLSGGEGQRVRLARALLREPVRLAILDEPFRGLAGDKRRELLEVARQRWCDVTLIYVSHDIDTAFDFDRVLVIENGQIVEDGPPHVLLDTPDSRFCALREAQAALDHELWRNPVWRRWRMEKGELRERDAP